MSFRTSSAVALAIAAVAAAGCGSKKNDTSTAASSAGAGSTAATPTTGADTTPTTTVLPFRVTAKLPIGKNTKVKPKIPTNLAKLTAPPRLIVDDVVTGKGKAAKAGDALTMDYVGVSYDTGQQFDTSWGKSPFQFTLGQGNVIQGWDLGIVGMKVGGRRTLIIPSELGYGASGSPPAIAPNEPLVFVVDLRKIG